MKPEQTQGENLRSTQGKPLVLRGFKSRSHSQGNTANHLLISILTVMTVSSTWLSTSTSWFTMMAQSTGFLQPSTAAPAQSRYYLLGLQTGRLIPQGFLNAFGSSHFPSRRFRTFHSTGRTAAWFSARTPTMPPRWTCSTFWMMTAKKSTRSW